MLYPLKFHPIFKNKIWGGQKIKQLLNKDFGTLPNCGETWEISGMKDHVSVVAQGTLAGALLTDLINEYGAGLLGASVLKRFGGEFPLLIKFIDAQEDLSIQVHPNDDLAQRRHQSFGKTEMWYVVQADAGASLISGFNQALTKKKYIEKFNQGKLEDLLNREQVSQDDVFFLPAGRIHTIGKGLLVAEIQQASDITYRIYDFHRTDTHGQPRSLHVAQALDAIDYKQYDEYKTRYDPHAEGIVPLVQCPYFETNKINIHTEQYRDLTAIDSFVIYMVLAGEGKLQYRNGSINYQKGDCLLIPAACHAVTFLPQHPSKILETFVPH